jgi:glycosyltransferase involved in cell wall biosynthesis
MLPTISVLMSVYNGANYIVESIDSILAQTVTEFEFIIIDDCSVDKTSQILNTYAQQDNRIRIIRNPENKGLTASLNIGLAEAQGKYVARQDADDISLPQRFKKQIQYLEAHPESVLTSSNIGIIDDEGKYRDTLKRAAPPNLVYWYLLFYNHVGGHSSVMFRREAVLEVGGYNTSYRYSQDYDLWTRLLYQGEIAILPETLIHWRTHPSNITGQRFEQQEHLSLLISQREIQRLTDQTYSLELIAALRRFWLEISTERCLYPVRLDPILRQVYRQFKQHNNAEGIGSLVAERYIHHARAISIRQNPLHKLNLWRYAARWHFLALLREWKRYAKSSIGEL